MKGRKMRGGALITDEADVALDERFEKLNVIRIELEEFDDLMDTYIADPKTESHRDAVQEAMEVLDADLGDFNVDRNDKEYQLDTLEIERIRRWIEKIKDFVAVIDDSKKAKAFVQANPEYAEDIKSDYKSGDTGKTFMNRMYNPFLKGYLTSLKIPFKFDDTKTAKDNVKVIIPLLEGFIEKQKKMRVKFEEYLKLVSDLKEEFKRISMRFNKATFEGYSNKEAFLRAFLKVTDEEKPPVERLESIYDKRTEEEFEELKSAYLMTLEPAIRENFKDLDKEELMKAVISKKEKEIIQPIASQPMSEASRAILTTNVAEKERFIDRVIQEMRRLGLIKDDVDAENIKKTLMEQDVPTLLESTKYFTKDFEKLFTGTEREQAVKRAVELVEQAKLQKEVEPVLLERRALSSKATAKRESVLKKAIEDRKKRKQLGDGSKKQAIIDSQMGDVLEKLVSNQRTILSSDAKPSKREKLDQIEDKLFKAYFKRSIDQPTSLVPNPSPASIDRRSKAFRDANKINTTVKVGGQSKRPKKSDPVYPWEAVNVVEPARPVVEQFDKKQRPPKKAPTRIVGTNQYDEGREEMQRILTETETNYMRSVPRVYSAFNDEFTNQLNTRDANLMSGALNLAKEYRKRFL
jgi:hypothetical protein